MSSSEMTMQTESEDLQNETALLDVVAKSSDNEQKKAKSSTSTLEDLIDRLEFNEVDEDEKGNGVGVCGMMWDVFSSRQLRMICVRFGIKGYKNKKKTQTIEIIERWCKAKKVYKSMHEGYSLIQEPRKEVQCAFRLINILFSDEFASDFATIGKRYWIPEKPETKCTFGSKCRMPLLGQLTIETTINCNLLKMRKFSTLCTTLIQATLCSMIGKS
jgi:hypothetical protein